MFEAILTRKYAVKMEKTEDHEKRRRREKGRRGERKCVFCCGKRDRVYVFALCSLSRKVRPHLHSMLNGRRGEGGYGRHKGGVDGSVA